MSEGLEVEPVWLLWGKRRPVPEQQPAKRGQNRKRCGQRGALGLDFCRTEKHVKVPTGSGTPQV